VTTTRRALEQFRRFVVRPTLELLEMGGAAAEDLLVGTALHESGLEAFDQWTGAGDEQLGPAIGVYQIEPATLLDLERSFLRYRPRLWERLEALTAEAPARELQLATNLAFATAVARLLYWRAPEPLPAAGDADALALYWKRHFNTAAGKGDPALWAAKYRALVA
jgi:hypothetical protein